MFRPSVLQVIAVLMLGATLGYLAASRNHCSSQACEVERALMSNQTSANSLADTSAVCADDYCGCFPETGRESVLTKAAADQENSQK